MFSVPSWFCCLNPTERGVLRSTGEALVLTLYVGVPKDVWDAFWFGAVGVNEDRMLSFIEGYLLEIVTIPLGDPEVDTVVVRPSYLPFWVEVASWLLLPDAACLGGCSWFVFP